VRSYRHLNGGGEEKGGGASGCGVFVGGGICLWNAGNK